MSTLRRGDDETRDARVGFAMKECGAVNRDYTGDDSAALRYERDVPGRVQIGDPAPYIGWWRVIAEFGEQRGKPFNVGGHRHSHDAGFV